MQSLVYVRQLCVVLLLFQCLIQESSSQFQEFGSKEYYVEKTGFVRSYNEAEKRCAQQDSTLAVVDTKAIHQFLVQQIGNLSEIPYSFFIGLRRINDSNEPTPFRWRDESPLTWTNWLVGEPNNSPTGGSGSEDCVIMGWAYELDSSYQWRDVLCDFTSRFVCEKPIGSRSRAEVRTSTTTTTITATTKSKQSGTTSTATKTTSTTTNLMATISNTQQEIIIYAAIGGGALLVAIIIVVIVSICHKKKKKDHKSNSSHDPNVIYETIEESSCGSRQPVYNEIYKSSDYNNRQNGAGYLVPTRHGTNAYSQIYLRPDGSLYQDHMEPPPVPSTLPKRERKSNNKHAPNV